MGVRISVVIPAYGRPDWLVKCVRSLAQQSLPASEYDVWVIDSSPDETNQKLMRGLAAEVPFRLHCLRKRPEGPGPSRTLGARQSDSPFIAFLDSDCYATPGWLRAGLAAFESGIGIVQGRVLPDPCTPTGVFTHYMQIEKESHFYETANIFYRREAFDQSGGFPADLTPLADTPIGGEDTEAAWSAKRLGWGSRFDPEALVYHEVRPIGLRDWICIRRMYRVPGLVARFPELRGFMFAKYFYDRAQSYLLLALFGLAAVFAFPPAAILALPYALHRASEPSRTLSGILRPARVAAYFLRDLTSLFLLLSGSIRYRALLL
jgi:cellulose synthase/poly-beta-1,6-N-acetylglucosamine synthase-like glycosyltransferase